MSDLMNRLTREAREDWGRQPPVDWDSVSRGVFGRIDRDRRDRHAALATRPSWTWKTFGAVVVLAAALVSLVVGKTREPRALDLPRPSDDDGIGNIVAIDGNGEVLVDGKRAGVGAALHLGDSVESRDAQVVLGHPGTLTVVIERDSRATVTHTHGTIVMALARGSIEAQVAPVSRGEAFAIDVGRSRVAVHGTHLRVSRTGDHVVVDLTEGTVSVGDAPRVGSTLGVLINAPAHAEFVFDDAKATLTVSHDDPSAFHQAMSLRPVPQPPPPFAGPVPPAASKPDPRDVVPAAVAPVSTTPVQSAPVEPPPAPDEPALSPQVPRVDPEAAIVAAVRACMAERPRVENVTVVVSTTLRLDLYDDGAVRAARFEPPVAPDINACAAVSIYKTRLTQGGVVLIPIDFEN